MMKTKTALTQKGLPGHVTMRKDYTGIYFLADLNGETPFKSAQAADMAYWTKRRELDAIAEQKRRESPNRLEFDGTSLRVTTDGVIEQIIPCDSVRRARQLRWQWEAYELILMEK